MTSNSKVENDEFEIRFIPGTHDIGFRIALLRQRPRRHRRNCQCIARNLCGRRVGRKLEANGQVDVALTLKKLRTGDIGGSGGVAAKFSKAEWQGLIGGINSQITELQAGQADKVRECLKPYMPGIVDAILKANR